MTDIPVLILTTELRRGGAEEMVLALAIGLSGRGFAPVVAALDGRGSVGNRLRWHGIPVWDLGAPSSRNVGCILRLRKLVRKLKPALVHTHMFHASICGRLAVAGLGIPLISTIHIAESRPKRWQFILDRLTGLWCQERIAVSGFVARFHAGKIGTSPDKVTVIPNGIDLERFHPPGDEQRREARRHLNLPPDGLVVGAMGRFDPQKGLDIYLDALELLAEDYPEVEFILAGYGPLGAEYQLRCESGPLAGRVRFPGEQADPVTFYHALDILAFPSRYEGFGLVLAEAMACGVAVVASDLPVVREVAGDDEPAARLCKTEDTQSLADSLRQLLDDEKLRERYSQQGAVRACDFSLDKMVSSYERLYHRFLSEPKAEETE